MDLHSIVKLLFIYVLHSSINSMSQFGPQAVEK